jgi:hypothetical protein
MLSMLIKSKKIWLVIAADSHVIRCIANGVMIVVTAMVLAVSPVVTTHAADKHEVGIVPPDDEEMDASKREACDCCQKCKAAKSPIESSEKQPPKHKNGCEDCCGECGKELKPSQQEHPPEVIEKNIPPEVIEHKSRPE